MTYPDETKNRKGLNPIGYPDLKMGYVVRVKPDGAAFRIILIQVLSGLALIAGATPIVICPFLPAVKNRFVLALIV